MRKLVTKQEAEDLLKPYKAILAEVIRSALLDWNKLLAEAPQLTGGLRGRTRASYIHERIVYRLQAVISQHPGLRLLRVRGGLAVVVVRDQLALKLKKLDDQLRSRNVMTGQTKLFNAQGVLEGTDVAATNATAGYALDSLAALPVRLVVVCWNDDEKLWEVELEEQAGEAGGTILPILAEPSGGNKPRSRVHPKTSKDEQASDEV